MYEYIRTDYRSKGYSFLLLTSTFYSSVRLPVSCVIEEVGNSIMRYSNKKGDACLHESIKYSG